MANRKKTVTIVLLAFFVLIGTSATTSHEKKFRNLKILPQDINERQLDSIMGAFNQALKVSCDFCHTPAQNTFPLTPVADGLDFSSDNNPMKQEARKMMRLTIDLNKTYFNQDTSIQKPDYLLNVVTCNTCHRGNPFPAHE